MDGWIVLEETTVGAIGIRLLAGSALRALKGAGASERTLKPPSDSRGCGLNCADVSCGSTAASAVCSFMTTVRESGEDKEAIGALGALVAW